MHDFDAVNLMTTINKIKASISAIFKNDEKLIDKARHIYFDNNTISLDKKINEDGPY